MEILFIVDKVEGLSKKLAMLESLGSDVKVFVHSKLVAKITRNKAVVNKIVSIYNNNVNETIDKYLKGENYNPTDSLIYYSSAELTNNYIEQIREDLKLKPDMIRVKKKLKFWDKFKLWFYQKVVKVIFNKNDEYASIKLQYFSAEMMNYLAHTNFRNRIFEVENSLKIELEDGKEETFYEKSKFNKNYLYNPIVFCLILICYVVAEKFLKLQFWVYFLVIALLLTTIINLIIMITINLFNERFKK